MKVCLTLICLFFLRALQDGDSVRTIRGIEGTTITFGCKFIFPGSTKFFCKEICEGENILIETTEDRAQRGRYSIEYEKHRSESIAVYVSISELKRSDSGRYRCGLDKSWTRYDDFDLDVTEASNTSGPNWTLKTFPSTLVTSSSLTLTQRLSSSSSSSSYETTQQTRTSPEPKGLLLYMFLSLVIKIILFSTPLVIFCRKRRAMKSKDSAVETEYDDISQINPEREESQRTDRKVNLLMK
ncbi:uncharacterized protein LOC106960806 isoform X6 [Poecilia latipinna]|uniref:uncharacterized protein LOC106960806 isoform X6 n=1 Tax=Poecilia latipinna TaxID=48699 RepID=UPI00072EBEB9|nr:PREDICTED: uncharacterized protein LOC106960806 isoform X6 [Poecilia latipinna]